MLRENADDAVSGAEARGPLFWIGARSGLYAALDGLRELRPGLRLRHYASVAEARHALPLERPGLLFVREELAASAEFAAFMKETCTNSLKQAPLHVVTDSRGEYDDRESRNPRAIPGGSAQPALQVPDDTRLTALLDLLLAAEAHDRGRPRLLGQGGELGLVEHRRQRRRHCSFRFT